MPALILRSVLERVSVGTEDKTVIRAINRGRLRSGTSEWEELIFWEQETVEPVVCYRDPDACPCFNRKAIPVWTHPVGACVSQPASITMACCPTSHIISNISRCSSHLNYTCLSQYFRHTVKTSGARDILYVHAASNASELQAHASKMTTTDYGTE